ncbi:MAG: hypothetical protein F6J93_36550 [Oscillatoria sp. SIO1A7]|nr:hypothetical protein [Oscillatoria sp. SIO1A7]
MNTYLPYYEALWMAENLTATLQNIYTLGGALVRDRVFPQGAIPNSSSPDAIRAMSTEQYLNFLAIALTVAVKERSWTGTKFAAIVPNAL